MFHYDYIHLKVRAGHLRKAVYIVNTVQLLDNTTHCTLLGHDTA
jgi:hypothetical protein